MARMRPGLLGPGFVAVTILTAEIGTAQIRYPETRKTDQVDDYFGTTIADPYRWLEDDNSPETAKWVEAQNAVTFGFLEQIPSRERIKARLTELWNYERFGLPSREGDLYVFSRNTGLQKQSVLYKTRTLDGPLEVLIDPNTFSADGTDSLASSAFSDDGRLMAYAKSVSGSDWREWRVREVATAKDLPDVVKWSKFSGAAWRKDGSGFYYSRFDAPKEGDELQAVNKNQKVFFHKVGTPQEADELVLARPDHPMWGFGGEVTEDGRFLLIYQSEGTERENRIFVQDLTTAGSKIEPFLDQFDASYQVVGNDGERFYVLTDKDASRNRLVAINRSAPQPDKWTTLIPEGPNRDVLSTATMIGNRFIVSWQIDAQERLRVYGLDGRLEREIDLPGIGSVTGMSARRRDKEAFYAFTSYTYPTTIFRYDPATGQSTVFRRPAVKLSPEAYETTQVFYPSKDGTKIPMFLTYRKGLVRNGQTPTLLYGYGGFNISMNPGYSPATAGWLEMGGIYAVANLRGGGEYGKAWHDGGRLANKQNVFDDFIAAAEYLIREKYTSTPKLAISGGSNGGLLVGACLTQRPDLFGAALPAVGVLDMLRFHKFTIGWAWKSDFGSAETREGFDTLVKYSPLHRLRPGTKYPPTLITTADHDDRVVPAHSFKFAAALQAAQAGPAPVLIRIETKTGHGGGRPVDKQIAERADVFAFLTRVLEMEGAGGPATTPSPGSR
jgi:prolyl oligopeptidase